MQYFLAIEFFPAAVFFHHHVRDFIDALVGGEALAALQALAPAADGLRFFALARVYDFIVGKSAKRTFHGANIGGNETAEPKWI